MKTLPKNCLPLSAEFSDALNADTANHTHNLVLHRGTEYIQICGMMSNGNDRTAIGIDKTYYSILPTDDICVLE